MRRKLYRHERGHREKKDFSGDKKKLFSRNYRDLFVKIFFIMMANNAENWRK